MKILHVVPSFYPAHVYGGPIESVYALCRHSAAQGCKVRVLSTDANGLDRVLEVETDRETTLAENVHVRYCRRLARHSVSLELLGRLLEYIRWSDVVHLTAVYSFPTLPTLLACKLLGKPLIWSPRGALQRWSGSTKVGRKKLWHALCASVAPREITLHVTSAQEAKESQLVFPSAQTVVIPNGVEVRAGEKPPRDSSRLGLLFLGRLDAKKGIENLLDACALLREHRRINFFLAIAGAGTAVYEQALQTRIAALGLTDSVKMLGALHGADKSKLLERADLVIVPSHTENFALVVAEALAHATPVIAGTGTPWQKLADHGCGLWVSNDATSLAEAIEKMAQLPLREMGQRGRAWMDREFSWPERTGEMIELYRSSLKVAVNLAAEPA
jgi:glycosyltransferase involved in cell wall biosynthesis